VLRRLVPQEDLPRRHPGRRVGSPTKDHDSSYPATSPGGRYVTGVVKVKLNKPDH
jgi:hypothetical protein